MPKKEILIKHVTLIFAYLLIVWGFYRYLFKLPDEIEEVIIKPILWLIPIFYIVGKEKLHISSLGLTSKNFFKAIYTALALGFAFAIEGFLINFVKYGGKLNFSANLGSYAFLTSLGLSFATAISEEITFRGYLFNRVWYISKNEWTANIIVSLFWGVIHIPLAVFGWNLNLAGTIGYVILTIIFGIGSAFLFARTKSVYSSILLHVFWEWPIMLFR